MKTSIKKLLKMVAWLGRTDYKLCLSNELDNCSGMYYNNTVYLNVQNHRIFCRILAHEVLHHITKKHRTPGYYSNRVTKVKSKAARLNFIEKELLIEQHTELLSLMLYYEFCKATNTRYSTERLALYLTQPEHKSMEYLYDGIFND